MSERGKGSLSAALVLQAMRYRFLTGTAVPVIVAAAMTFERGTFAPGYFAIVLLAIGATQSAVNVLNDYYDHLSGNDDLYPKPSPFSGGARLIQAGLLTSGQTLAIAIGCFLVAFLALLYLGFARGWDAWWLALAALGLAIFYSAPPLRLSYVGHGLGELAVGLGLGPVMLMGAYYIGAQRLDGEPLLASVAVGMLGAALVHINEFPDYHADRDVQKNTLVVVLGPARAVWTYAFLIFCPFVILAAGLGLGMFPLPCAVAFLTLPIAVQCLQNVQQFHSDAVKLIPANAGTVKLHLFFGVAFALGYAGSGLLS